MVEDGADGRIPARSRTRVFTLLPNACLASRTIQTGNAFGTASDVRIAPVLVDAYASSGAATSVRPAGARIARIFLDDFDL